MGRVIVTEDDFDIGKEMDSLKQSGVGAIASFVGIVRDYAEGPSLIAMTLEHYEGMTEQEISNIIDIACDRWPLADVTVIHRIGRLLPHDNIVFVGTASAHREAAFEGAHFIMDYLKTKAPFWKQEETEQGASWVDARETDDTALEKWR